MYLVSGFGALVIAALAVNAIVRRKKRIPKSHYDVQNRATYDVEGHRKFSREFRKEIEARIDRDNRPWH